MAKQFLTHINLSKNELQNALMHPLGTAPASPGESQIYYNSGSKKLFLYNGTAWVDITGTITAITTATPAVTIDVTDPAAPVIDVADATGVNSGLLTSAFFNDLTNATSANTASTLVERDASGDFAANDITANKVTGLVAPSVASDAANKAYVDTLVSSGMTIKGATDASTNPNYPVAIVGDAYHISVAGKIGGASGEVVEAGDVVLCITDSAGGTQAAVGAEWIILQANADQATEVIIGLARIATAAEVTTGTNDDAYITPLKLATALAGVGSGTVAKYTATVGNGTNTQYTVNHALGEQYCLVQLYDAVSNEEVIADIELVDANNASVTFTVAPTTNAIRVIVTG
jgi:hypothetical protein